MEHLLSLVKKILPSPIANALRSVWHPTLSFFSALFYGFPARKLTIIGINGTKGKSTTAEMMFAILEHAGHPTALASTIRFAIGEQSTPNIFKMTMPGRGYVQSFLKKAVAHGATHAVVELTTEGAREWRHRFLSLNALVMLNVQKEHIERFGSFENYVKAKWWLVRELERSKKHNRSIVVNVEKENAEFLNASVENQLPFSKNELEGIASTEHKTTFTYKNVRFTIPIAGEFNALNALSALKVAEQLGIPLEVARDGLASMQKVQGRLELVEQGQPFHVVVDYAHTPDSLSALYSAFPTQRKICVLGNTGGGRDTWKRPLMGEIADTHCDVVILTNEDPYDEDPKKILQEMTATMKRAPIIELDRRRAIARALSEACAGDVVLISGKGTDPYIMEAHGKKTPWSDVSVVKEELTQLTKKTV